MPIIKSAKKRVKVNAKATARNVRTKRAMREALKAFAQVLENGPKTKLGKAQAKAVSAVDMAAKKAVIHQNKAARVKARLSAQAKAAGAIQAKSSKALKAKSPSPAPAKKTIKKSPAKKATPKKVT